MSDTLLSSNAIDRRTLLQRAGLGGASVVLGGLLAGCGGNDHHSSSSSDGPSDLDVLNFALNLEYLEASYYTTGVNNYQLASGQITGTATGTNSTAGGAIIGGRAVTFSTLGPYFQEIAYDESKHVAAVRSVIVARGGTPVARPEINFTDAFAAAGAAANNPGFDPFANETNFLLGAFLLSDIGATAYVGGSQYLRDANVKLAAAKILAVEGYHVGAIRTLIANAGGTAIAQSQAIASARETLNAGQSPTIDDQGVDEDPNVPGAHNIALTDVNGLAFGRSTSEVLTLAYLNKTTGTASGGFFTKGANGNIRFV